MAVLSCIVRPIGFSVAMVVKVILRFFWRRERLWPVAVSVLLDYFRNLFYTNDPYVTNPWNLLLLGLSRFVVEAGSLLKDGSIPLSLVAYEAWSARNIPSWRPIGGHYAALWARFTRCYLPIPDAAWLRQQTRAVQRPRHPPGKNHPHPDSVSQRAEARSVIACFSALTGMDTYDIQRSHDVPGCRTPFWGKDLDKRSEPYRYDPSAIQTLIDVDYYLDMPRLLSVYPAVYALYSLQPSAVAHTSQEFMFTFSKPDTLKMVMFGGETYEHGIWNYSTQSVLSLTAPHMLFPRKATYYVERVQITKHSQVIFLIPFHVMRLPLAIATWFQENPLPRLNVGTPAGDYTRLTTLTTKGQFVSTGRLGAYNCVSLPVSADDSISEVARAQVSDISVHSIASKLKLDPIDAALAVNYHRLIYLKNKPRENIMMLARAPQTVTYTYSDVEPKPLLHAFMLPLVEGAFVPSNDESTEAAAIVGRVYEPAANDDQQAIPSLDEIADARIPAALIRDLQEFVRIAHGPFAHRLSPASDDVVRERQCRPNQRRNVETGLNSLCFDASKPDENMPGFLKAENYSSLKDPRLISNPRPGVKVAYAKYLYAMDEVFDRFPWYAFGRTPVQIAGDVALLAMRCQSKGLQVACDDFSIMDGHKNFLSRALWRSFQNGLFRPEYVAELDSLFNSCIRQKVQLHWLHFDSQLAQASGDSATSRSNTTESAAIRFCARRDFYRDTETPQQSYDALGLYGGDDTCDEKLPEDVVARIAGHFGHIIKFSSYSPGQTGINFLGRIYGPHVWNGDTNSMCNIKRQLIKLHLSTRLQPGQKPIEKLAEKIFSYSITDANTPILRELVSAFPMPHFRRLPHDAWWSLFDPAVQFPNTYAVWMDAIVDEQFSGPFGSFDYHNFRTWINKAKDDESAWLCPPVCWRPAPVVATRPGTRLQTDAGWGAELVAGDQPMGPPGSGPNYKSILEHYQDLTAKRNQQKRKRKQRIIEKPEKEIKTVLSINKEKEKEIKMNSTEAIPTVPVSLIDDEAAATEPLSTEENPWRGKARANDDTNEYLISIVDPVNYQSAIPDASADLSALRRIVCSSTITVPNGVQDASLMFVWIPRARNTQILVMGARAGVWGFLTWLNFELDPLESYRLFRVCSGLLSLDSGTIATGVTQLGGFQYAIYSIGLPNLFGVNNPSELLQYRRSENGQMTQTPLFKGLRMLVPPDGDPGFNQPDNRYVPTAVTSSGDPPTFAQAALTDAAYYRTGQFTVQRTDETIQVEIGNQDTGWLSTSWGVYDSADTSVTAMTTLWSSGTSAAEFPPFPYGEIDVQGSIPVTISIGSSTNSVAYALVLRLAIRVPRMSPTSFTLEPQNFEYVTEIINYTEAIYSVAPSQVFDVPFHFRYRPTGPFNGLLLQGAYMNYTGSPQPITGAAYYPYNAVVGGGGTQALRRTNGGSFSIRLMDMSTKSGMNSPNLVAILGALSPAQVISINAAANLEFVPNEVLAPNVKVYAQNANEDDMRVARLAVAVSPVFRGIYTSEDYAKALLFLAEGNLSRERLQAHALDWGRVWNGIKKAVGFIAPTVNSLATAFNPMLGQVTSGITGLIANSRDSRALARDSRALSADRYDTIPVQLPRRRARASDPWGRVLGPVQCFPTEQDTPDGSLAGGLWRLSLHAGQPPPRLIQLYRRLTSDPRIFVPLFVEDTDTRIFQMLYNMVGEDFTMRIDTHPSLDLDGHSWHAAALASAANCHGRTLWTGSPFVPPGALDYKYAVARTTKKHLIVLGSTLEAVQDALPGVTVQTPLSDVVPNCVIVLGIESGPGLSTQTIPMQYILRQVAASTMPRANEEILPTSPTVAAPVNTHNGIVTRWRELDARAAIRPWLAWLRSYDGPLRATSHALRVRLEGLSRKATKVLTAADIRSLLHFKAASEETPRSKL